MPTTVRVPTHVSLGEHQCLYVWVCIYRCVYVCGVSESCCVYFVSLPFTVVKGGSLPVLLWILNPLLMLQEEAGQLSLAEEGLNEVSIPPLLSEPQRHVMVTQAPSYGSLTPSPVFAH